MMGSRGSATQDGLLGLLALVSDPHRVQAAIKECLDATAKHDAARESAILAKDDADARHARADQREQAIAIRERELSEIADRHHSVSSQLSDHERALLARSDDLDAKEADLIRREQLLSEASQRVTADFLEREMSIQASSDGLKDRAAQLDARAAALDSAIAEAQALKADYEARIARLTEIVGAK